ncbi:DUF488 domain-containing protein [Candidatus Leptofilum sp.]|uniref:DUF488 domain-containing protein n=1 Tax=Candidatus Leptofilum sp. TaxID=3241576 RepID=UPI003B5AB33B
MNDDEITFQIKRIYDTPDSHDGFRVLVDRLWPRGIRKEDAQLDLWLGDISPSSRLRKWFGHDPTRWDDFLERYFAELDANPQVVTELFQKATSGKITLLFAAKDVQHNHAVALKMYLEGEE